MILSPSTPMPVAAIAPSMLILPGYGSELAAADAVCREKHRKAIGAERAGCAAKRGERDDRRAGPGQRQFVQRRTDHGEGAAIVREHPAADRIGDGGQTNQAGRTI